MGEINRELLLGYLMNALEDDEISRVERELLRQPKLRAELAGLQRELSPLNFVLETVEPPPNLARKTCDKIWAFVDREEEIGSSFDRAVQSGPILPLNLPSPHFADQGISGKVPVPNRAEIVEELLAASPQISEPAKRLVRRNEKKTRLNRKDRIGTAKPRATRKRGRWIDVFAAVGVGILIAVVVFPAINSSKNQVQGWIAQSKINRITQNVGVYTDLQGTGSQVLAEEPAPQLNFANCGWQELKPDQMLLVVNNDVNTPDTQLDIMPGLVPSNVFPPVSGDSEGAESLMAESHGNGVLSGPSDIVFAPTYPISLTSPGDISGQTLFSGVGPFLPVSSGSMLQTAYGQNVLFRNGKIFVRRLPVNTPSE